MPYFSKWICMNRAEWGSRLGFILAAAGSAVGLGAVWKFPYVTVKNGGGAFLLIYLLISFTLGIFMMISEMSMGQISKNSVVGAYRTLGGKKWTPFGYIGVTCGFLILSFYSVVGGWTIAYIVKSFEGHLLVSDPQVLAGIFHSFVAHPVEPLMYHALFMVLTAGVVLAGIEKGIERVSKSLMALLFLLMLILIGRGLTLPGALEGAKYFLMPDFSKLTAHTLIDALGLSFFSLSLGMGMMITYGSYVSKETSIPGSAASVIGLTTGACALSGLMVLPTVFAFGFDLSIGAGLTFITMPAVFSKMMGGQLFAVFFFFLLLVAALTSSVSLMEVVTSFFIDEFRMRRIPVAIVTGIIMFVVGIAASLSFGILESYTLFGKNIFDLLDYLTSNLLMPIGGLGVSVLVGWKAWDVIEANLMTQYEVKPWWVKLMKAFCHYLSPLLILLILIQSASA